MALTNGMKLGPYEIMAPIGAGGMGEVYRARDTRLERTVAIKILPAHLSDDATFRRQDATDFIVMEYLEGETLAARLEKGPLPLAHVLQYGIQIAGALDKAHRNGVVHRDGNESGRGTRFFIQEIGGGMARPVTPEGTRDGLLSRDGRLVLARGSEGKYSVYPIAGGDPQPVPGLMESDVIAQWSADGRSVLVYRRRGDSMPPRTRRACDRTPKFL